MSKLTDEVARSTRYGSNLSIMLFDLDNFKDVNDTYGHLAGDSILKELGRILKGSLRSLDSVGRYGGEEFLVILPETDGDSAKLIGERLRRKVEEIDFIYGDNRIRLTICGGLGVH